MATINDTEEMEKDIEDLRKTILEDQLSYDVRACINEFSGDQKTVEGYKAELQKLDAMRKAKFVRKLGLLYSKYCKLPSFPT